MNDTSNSITKNICVIGGGNWGKNHIKTLQSLNCLAGVVDSDESVINAINKIYPTCKVFSNIDDALSMNFDGYIIATGPSSHHSLAKKIISGSKSGIKPKKGKPVHPEIVSPAVPVMLRRPRIKAPSVSKVRYPYSINEYS